MAAPIMKVTAITGMVSSESCKKNEYPKPIPAVGTVAIAIRGISIPFSDLKSRRKSATSMFFTSLRKYRITTDVVPRCSSKLKRGDAAIPKKVSASLRCAVLEMGSHSVKP